MTEVSNSRRWSIVGLLFVASAINYFDRGTISVALPFLSHELHFGPEVKGLLLSAFFWSYASMQLPMGWLADRANLRWLYTGAFALWSLAQGMTGLAAALGALIVFRILLGIGEAIYLPGGTKIVSLLFAPKDRGLPCGLFDCGTRAGLAVGAPLTALLIVHYGWRKMFLLAGLAGILWLIPWFMAFPASFSTRDRRAAARPASPRLVTWDRNLLGICIGFFCFDYYWYLLVSWLPDYLMTARHLPVMKAGLYAALPYIVFGASEPLAGWIADRLIHLGWDETKTRKGFVTGAFLTGLLLIPAARVATANHAIWLVAGASLVGFATANLIVILQCCAPDEEIGIWTGFENLAGNVGGVLAPLLTGVLIQWTGSYFPGFALAAGLLVAGIAAYWLIVGELKPIREAG
jgi:MFS transporter, ACS family, D-galactonate transporter